VCSGGDVLDCLPCVRACVAVDDMDRLVSIFMLIHIYTPFLLGSLNRPVCVPWDNYETTEAFLFIQQESLF
jgi:hypothetical protein